MDSLIRASRMWRWRRAVILFVLLLGPYSVLGRSYPTGSRRSSVTHKHGSWRSFGSFREDRFEDDEIHHYSYGTEVPGSSAWQLAGVHRRLLDDDDEEDTQTGSPEQAPTNAPGEDSSPADAPRNEERSKKSKVPDEAIAGAVFGLFFVTAFLILVIYVCKTRKFIEQRREASLARGRSLDFDLAAGTSASVSPPISSSPSLAESSYIPPSPEIALYSQASRGSSTTLEHNPPSPEIALYSQASRGSSTTLEQPEEKVADLRESDP